MKARSPAVRGRSLRLRLSEKATASHILREWSDRLTIKRKNTK
jgi:hypothetical protein